MSALIPRSLTLAVPAAIAMAASLPLATADSAAAPPGGWDDKPVFSDAKCSFKVKKRLPLERVLARGLTVVARCDGPASVGALATFRHGKQRYDWIDLHPGGVPGIANCEHAELERAGTARLTCKGFPGRFMRRYPKTTLEIVFGRERLDNPGVFRGVGDRNVVLVR